MIKKLLFISTACLALSAQAIARDVESIDSIVAQKETVVSGLLQPNEPTYLRDVTQASGWRDNWFVGINGGVSAFAGSPLGCEDLFGRMKPTMSLYAGKWFTPAVGARASFEGFKLKNAEIKTIDYKLAHADLLWNVASHFNKARDQPRWGAVPYIGLGLIHNEENGNSPFGFSYGVLGQYRLTQRLLLNMELGGFTTFKDFDGIGARNEFGDNLLSLSVGLSVTVGKSGWKRVVDAKPYMRQNELLRDYAQSLCHKNSQLKIRRMKDARVIAELQKIIEIEGLLDKYGDRLRAVRGEGETDEVRIFPRNDYSGLNSLMARLRNRKWSPDDRLGSDASLADNADEVGMKTAGDSASNSASPSDERAWNDYLISMSNNRECIGAPIYFFFKLDTTTLNDRNQLINLDEIVRVAKKHDLRIRVTGAADSATGSKLHNKTLSSNRAHYICEQLKARGLDEKYIARVSVGGIDDFSPMEGNRQTKIELFFEPTE